MKRLLLVFNPQAMESKLFAFADPQEHRDWSEAILNSISLNSTKSSQRLASSSSEEALELEESLIENCPSFAKQESEVSLKEQIKLLEVTDEVSAKFGSEDLGDDPLDDYDEFLAKMA